MRFEVSTKKTSSIPPVIVGGPNFSMDKDRGDDVASALTHPSSHNGDKDDALPRLMKLDKRIRSSSRLADCNAWEQLGFLKSMLLRWTFKCGVMEDGDYDNNDDEESDESSSISSDPYRDELTKKWLKRRAQEAAAQRNEDMFARACCMTRESVVPTSG